MTAAASTAPLPEVLLIDLSHLFWSAWHVTKDKPQSEASSMTQASIRRCVGELDGKLVAICCDQGRSFRKALSPDYKANRPEKDQSAIAELERLKETLRDQGYWLVGADGFEADDVIATLAHAASKAGHPIRVASGDKDLLQLLSLPDSSALRTYNDWPTMRAADVVTKLGVDPEGLRDWLALVGDASDNVKGCPSVGPKTATALLVAHYDIDTLYAKIEALGAATMTPEAKAIASPSVLEKLKANKADVMLARQLVTLRTDAPVSLAPIYERREPKKRRERTPMEDPTVDCISEPPPKEERAPKEPVAAVPQAPASVVVSAASASAGTATAGSRGESRALTLVPAENVTYERQLEPRTSSQAVALGEILYASRAFTRFPTAESLTACVLGGRELGLGAIASTNAFHFMAEMGCLALKAHTIIELGITHPKCEYIRLLHSDDVYAEYETKHRDHAEPFRWKFTAAQAVQMGLCAAEARPRTAPIGKGNKDDRSPWDKDRPGMIRKTCGIQIVRIVYPGAAQGFYGIEELGGDV